MLNKVKTVNELVFFIYIIKLRFQPRQHIKQQLQKLLKKRIVEGNENNSGK